MSDLQVALIGLGVLIIAGVVIYNWLQEKKLRQNITEDFIVPQKDVLVEEFYLDADALVDKEFEGDAHKSEIINKLNEEDLKEPTLTDAAALEVSGEEKTDQTAPETLTEVAVDDSPEPDKLAEVAPVTEGEPAEIQAQKNILPPEFEPAVTSSLPNEVHSQIDLTAFLYATKNIDGHALYEVAKTTLKDVGAAVSYHGLDDEGVWQIIDGASLEGVSYKQVACSLQLADRRGPVPKPVLNKFQFSIETLGLEFNAHVEWQGKGDPAVRAVDLDKFCMDVDQLVSVHLVQGDIPIHGTKFKGMAEADGMKLKHSKFCYFEDTSSEEPQFVLINADGQSFTAESLRSDIVRGATFQIEIPKVNDFEQAFNEMVTIAQKMADSLGARMVDDNQKTLGDLQVEKIRQQLNAIHATMVARGILPGSANSMRLFN